MFLFCPIVLLALHETVSLRPSQLQEGTGHRQRSELCVSARCEQISFLRQNNTDVAAVLVRTYIVWNPLGDHSTRSSYRHKNNVQYYGFVGQLQLLFCYKRRVPVRGCAGVLWLWEVRLKTFRAVSSTRVFFRYHISECVPEVELEDTAQMTEGRNVCWSLLGKFLCRVHLEDWKVGRWAMLTWMLMK